MESNQDNSKKSQGQAPPSVGGTSSSQSEVSSKGTKPSFPSNKGSREGIMWLGVLLIIVLGTLLFIGLRNNKKSPTTSTTQAVVGSAGQVAISSSGFVPSTITVKVGQGVTWTNTDKASHEVNSDPFPTDGTVSDFNDKSPILTNDQFSYVFIKAGTYTYHDDLNPYTFKGTVIVK